MEIFHDISQFNSNQSTILTIGTFDGMHFGHQNLMKNMVSFAKKEQLKSIVLTFSPTPNQFFSKKTLNNQINSIDEKTQLIKNQNIDYLIIQPFDIAFSNIDAKYFIEEILVKKFKIKKIIIGHDHRFGKNRTAGFDELQDFGKKYNFEVEKIEAIEIDNLIVSSSKIREFIENGNIETANIFLDYYYSLKGKVIHGKNIGAQLGFPTANIELKDKNKILPKNGVYFVKVELENHYYFGMMNIGLNPTFEDKKLSIEVHIFDFKKDIYGLEIYIKILRRLRDEQKFSDKTILINQLNIDKKNCIQ
jgi:riboflavin kinase/FMN adenylyltransferase